MQAYLELEQIQKLGQAATNVRDRLLIELPFHLGCRISEALALTTDDIDLEKGEVRILHLKSRIKMLCSNCQTRLGRSHSFCPGAEEKLRKPRNRNCRVTNNGYCRSTKAR